MAVRIEIPTKQMQEYCHRWRIAELSFFGSVLRDDFCPESDVDVLVAFARDVRYSLLDIVRMRDELATLLGREVDFVQEKGLKNPFRRREILRTKKVIYAA